EAAGERWARRVAGDPPAQPPGWWWGRPERGRRGRRCPGARRKRPTRLADLHPIPSHRDRPGCRGLSPIRSDRASRSWAEEGEERSSCPEADAAKCRPVGWHPGTVATTPPRDCRLLLGPVEASDPPGRRDFLGPAQTMYLPGCRRLLGLALTTGQGSPRHRAGWDEGGPTRWRLRGMLGEEASSGRPMALPTAGTRGWTILRLLR